MTDELYARLTAIQRHKRKIKEAEEDLETLFNQIVSPQAQRFDTDRVQSTPEDPMTEYAARAEKQEQKIAKLREDLPKVTEQTIAFIRKAGGMEYGKMHPERSAVLIAVYVQQKEYEQIKKEMGYSKPSLYRFRRDGLRVLEQIIAKEQQGKKLKPHDSSDGCIML